MTISQKNLKQAFTSPSAKAKDDSGSDIFLPFESDPRSFLGLYFAQTNHKILEPDEEKERFQAIDEAGARSLKLFLEVSFIPQDILQLCQKALRSLKESDLENTPYEKIYKLEFFKIFKIPQEKNGSNSLDKKTRLLQKLASIEEALEDAGQPPIFGPALSSCFS